MNGTLSDKELVAIAYKWYIGGDPLHEFASLGRIDDRIRAYASALCYHARSGLRTKYSQDDLDELAALTDWLWHQPDRGPQEQWGDLVLD